MGAGAGANPPPAAAQVAASIAIESDYRFRAHTLSDGRPAAMAQLAYDHPSGFYVNVAGIGALGKDELRFIGAQGNVGYATRLAPGLYFDAGLVRSEYEPIAYGRRAWHYTEAYVGLGTEHFTTRVSYSPDYVVSDASTLYGEVEAAFRPAPQWRLSAHVGALVYIKSPYYIDHTSYYDWRLGASREFGNLEVHAALSGGGPEEDYYGRRPRSKTAVTAGASWSF